MIAQEKTIQQYLESIDETRDLIKMREQIIAEKEKCLARANETINQMAMTNTKQAETIQQMATISKK